MALGLDRRQASNVAGINKEYVTCEMHWEVAEPHLPLSFPFAELGCLQGKRLFSKRHILPTSSCDSAALGDLRSFLHTRDPRFLQLKQKTSLVKAGISMNTAKSKANTKCAPRSTNVRHGLGRDKLKSISGETCLLDMDRLLRHTRPSIYYRDEARSKILVKRGTKCWTSLASGMQVLTLLSRWITCLDMMRK